MMLLNLMPATYAENFAKFQEETSRKSEPRKFSQNLRLTSTPQKVVEQKGSTEASLTDAPSLFGMEVDMEKIIKQME